VGTLFFQYGDYREAWETFRAGGEETYLDQRQSVDFVDRRALVADPVTLACVAATRFDAVLRPGLRVIGGSHRDLFSEAPAAAILADVKPSRVVVSVPDPGLLRAVAAHGAPAYACFADIFRKVRLTRGIKPALRDGLRNRRVVAALRARAYRAYGNHSLTSAQSLVDVLGLPAAKVIPWEWTEQVADPAPKVPGAGPWRVFYAGMLIETKGVGDLIAAAARLVAGGVDLTVAIAGDGEGRPGFAAAARAAGIGDRVAFLGRIAHAEVRARMRAADLVVVPSRHAYDEGLPNVIFEALAARTPVVVSDHPAFAARLARSEAVAVYPAGQAAALAETMRAVLADPARRLAMSEASAATLKGLYVGRSWYEVMGRFLDDPEDRAGWVAPWSLAAMGARA
jgi:glycosyltransferase involved in cell wall biosynthesis